MATAKVQQMITMSELDNCPMDDQNHKVQDTPKTEVEDAPRNILDSKGGDGEVITIDIDEAAAQEVEAKLGIKDHQDVPANADGPKEEARETKKTQKAATASMVVPVDDEPEEEAADEAKGQVMEGGGGVTGVGGGAGRVERKGEEGAREKNAHEE